MACIRDQSVSISGQGKCSGGEQITPSLASFPLLVWVDGQIKTEDGKLTMDQYLIVTSESTMFAILEPTSVVFGTTPEHVRQLAAYAVLAGFTNP